MPFKSGFVGVAPGVDPARHRTSIKTDKYEFTAVLVELGDFDQAVDVCKDLVQNEGIHALILCPAFSHEEVGRIVSAVGKEVPISIARSDSSGTRITGEILRREQWF